MICRKPFFRCLYDTENMLCWKCGYCPVPSATESDWPLMRKYCYRTYTKGSSGQKMPGLADLELHWSHMTWYEYRLRLQTGKMYNMSELISDSVTQLVYMHKQLVLVMLVCDASPGNRPSGICGQCSYKSACASIQSDLRATMFARPYFIEYQAV